jgi:hypothetical protein
MLSSDGSASLALGLLYHMIDDMAVLALRAEHNNLCVSIDPDVVSRGPVEQVIGVHLFLFACCISGGQLSAQDEAPMRTLTEVSFKPLEEWSGVYSSAKSEVFAANLAEPARVTELGPLTDDGAWDSHLDVDIFLCNSHV